MRGSETSARVRSVALISVFVVFGCAGEELTGVELTVDHSQSLETISASGRTESGESAFEPATFQLDRARIMGTIVILFREESGGHTITLDLQGTRGGIVRARDSVVGNSEAKLVRLEAAIRTRRSRVGLQLARRIGERRCG